MLVPDNETFDLDNEDTWPDWAWGLTAEQVRVIAASSPDPRKRHLHADGQRALNDMNRRSNIPGYDASRIRIPTYVSPTDRVEAGALVTETQPEAMSKAERKRRQRVPVPLDAESDVGPVNFTDVTDEDVSHFRPVDVPKRVRGPAGQPGHHQEVPRPTTRPLSHRSPRLLTTRSRASGAPSLGTATFERAHLRSRT